MEVPFQVELKEGVMLGVLTIPINKFDREVPAIVLCAGFQSNRIVENKFFVRMARALGEKGIASVRFDFLGCGVSSGFSHSFTYQDKVKQLNAVVDYVKYQPGIEGDRIGFIGFSEGCRLLIDYLSNYQPSIKKPPISLWSPSLLDPEPGNDPRVAKGKKVNNDLKRTGIDKKFALDMYGSWTHPRYFNYGNKEQNYVDKLMKIKDLADIAYFFGANDNLIGDTVPVLWSRLTIEEQMKFHIIPSAGHLYELEHQRETIIQHSLLFFMNHFGKVSAQ